MYTHIPNIVKPLFNEIDGSLKNICLIDIFRKEITVDFHLTSYAFTVLSLLK